MPIKNNGKCDAGVTAGLVSVCRTPSSSEASRSVGPKCHHLLNAVSSPSAGVRRKALSCSLAMQWSLPVRGGLAVGTSSLGLGT